MFFATLNDPIAATSFATIENQLQLDKNSSKLHEKHSPRIKPVAALPLNDPPQLLQLGYHLLDNIHPEPVPIIEERVQRIPESLLVQFPTPVLVPLQVGTGVGLVHLHAAQPDPQGGGSARRALRHLLAALLRARVVPMLPGPHFQVQDAGMHVARGDVFQHEEVLLAVVFRGLMALQDVFGGASVVDLHPGREEEGG